MARIARVVAAGLPHHVTQRGNRRQEVFFGPQDYQAYLSLMREWCIRHGLRAWAYCLMPNHVHLIVVPPSEQALCRAVGEAHRRYTRAVNFRQGWRGHLWQGRFGSFVMDDPYLMAAARYIERNPVRAGLVERAEQWSYSSAAAHVRGESDGWAEGDWLRERTAGWTCTWQEYLAGEDDSRIGSHLRRHENTGRPLGEKPFLERLSSLLGRELVPRRPGPSPRQES
jgi:putative transposase